MNVIFIDGIEYVSSAYFKEKIGVSKTVTYRKLITKSGLKYQETKGNIWVEKNDAERYLAYHQEKENIEKEWSKKVQQHKAELERKNIKLQHLAESYSFLQKKQITTYVIPNSNLIYNPFLFEPIENFELFESTHKIIKKLPIFFIGDLVHYSVDFYVPDRGPTLKTMMGYDRYSIGSNSEDILNEFLSKYNLRINMFSSKFYWPSPKLIQPPFSLRNSKKINEYKDRRQKEKTEIEDLLQISKVSVI